ncbi:PhlD [Streptomyces sp. NPDC004647]|uniref:type III polyketide synthase n=1 Tax=Streptomyces sp. NPDC004647 TaxID=3154671 RepID=UPI0033A7E097
MAFVRRPTVALAKNPVNTEEICDDIIRHHPEHPQLPAILRVIENIHVQQRPFVRPLREVAQTQTFEERNTWAIDGLTELAERAARQALHDAGLHPRDIGGLITSHATGLAIPGLDVRLVNRLGLRPTVDRVPMTQLACAGGAHALGLAATLVKALPEKPVLVVCAEVPSSSVYQHTDTDLPSMIFKSLFGDAGTAAIVTSTPTGPGIRIDDSWRYLLPDSADYYKLQTSQHGYHFRSTRDGFKAVPKIIPHLRAWLDGHTPGWEPHFAVAHPGGPAILEDLTKELGAPEHLFRHSWASLQQNGNLGGGAVLDVLARTHADPPPDGAQGLMIGFGPGFATAACRLTWVSTP